MGMAVVIPGIPGNDEYYEGLMTKNLLTTCCTQVLLLIFINYKKDEKQ